MSITTTLRRWARRTLGATTLSMALAWLSARAAHADEATSAPPGPEAPPPDSMVLDLNQASALELTQLPGIGPKRAEKIVLERRRRPFRSVNELTRVAGIGKKTLARLRRHLRVESKEGAADSRP
jgi:competence ComEA-like helix-hairpin-helix protein